MKPFNFPKGILALAMAALMAGCGGDEPVQPTPDPTPTPSPTPTPTTVAVTGVSLNKSTLSLEVDGSETLTATVTPGNAKDKTVSWKSSDSGIANVDGNGKVTAVKEGTATITVTTTDGSKTATCSVTVSAKTVPLSGLALNPSGTNIYEGQTITLEVVYTPADATQKGVTWESGNENVAVVDSKGVVTGISEGYVDIFATAKNGMRASCKVAVMKDMSVKGISFKDKSMEAFVGQSLTPELSFTPEYAENRNVTWESGDESVATVSEDGVVKGLSEGKTTITATSEDGGFKAVCEVSFTLATPAGVYWSEDRILFRDKKSLGTGVPFNACVDSDGNIFYYYLGKIHKNGVEFMRFSNDCNGVYSAAGGGYYFIQDYNPDRSILKLWKIDAENGTDKDIVLCTAPGKYPIWVNDVVADSKGNAYVAGRLTKDGSNRAALWKLGTNEKVTETLLSDGKKAGGCYAVDVNKNGDVFCLVQDGTYTGSYYNLYLYKNGKLVRQVSDKCVMTYSTFCDLSVVGNDVYTLVCENAGAAYVNSIKVYKNNKTLYTLKEGESIFATEIYVTSKGDVYCVILIDPTGNVESQIWKNGKLFYTAKGSIINSHSLFVKE